MKKIIAFFTLSLFVSTFIGCSSASDHTDLRAKIDDVKRNATGKVDPIPVYPPYEAFIYAAISYRSPFDRPVDITQGGVRGPGAEPPDTNRTKEYLEGRDLSSLSMVGTLKQNGTLWALIKDSDGRIHRVTKNNYLGKNHGKVVSAEDYKIELIEIVPNGLGGWVNRPNILALSEKE